MWNWQQLLLYSTFSSVVCVGAVADDMIFGVLKHISHLTPFITIGRVKGGPVFCSMILSQGSSG